MTLSFITIGFSEFLIVALVIALIIAIGNYGKDTQLGYTGSVLLAIFSSPIVAFAVLYYLKYKARTSRT